MFPMQIGRKISLKQIKMEASPNPVPPRANRSVSEVKSAFAAIIKSAISRETGEFRIYCTRIGPAVGIKGRFPVSEELCGDSEGQKGGEVSCYMPTRNTENGATAVV